MASLTFEKIIEDHDNRLARQFESLRKAKIINGEYESEKWVYRGQYFTLYKANVGAKHRGADKLQLRAESYTEKVLLRSVILESMKLRLSVSQLIGQRIAILIVGKVLSDRGKDWSSFSSSDFKAAVQEIQRHYTNSCSIYARATAVASSIQQLKRVKVPTSNGLVRIINPSIKTHHGLSNPIRSGMAIAATKENGGNNKWPSGLVEAIGLVRQKIISGEYQEPKSGYDVLRLEPLLFAITNGIRAGEIARLPYECLELDSDISTMLLRVHTEKGSPASARSVPDLWQKEVNKTVPKIKRICRDARAIASRLEREKAQYFIDRIRHSDSPLLSTEIEEALIFEGKEPEGYVSLESLTATFGVGKKYFLERKKLQRCSLLLPRKTFVRVVRFIDELSRSGEWRKIYSPPKTEYRVGVAYFTLYRFASLAGLARSATANIRYVNELMHEMNAKLLSVSTCGGKLTEAAEEEMRSWWRDKRAYLFQNCKASKHRVFNIASLANYLFREFEKKVAKSFRINPELLYSKSGRWKSEYKLSGRLIVVWESQFVSGTSHMGILPQPLEESDIYNYIADTEKSDKLSVFDRLDVRDKSGKIYAFSPHQIRHWLDSSLLRSGASEMALDVWLGRKPGTGRTYDHRTPRERAEAIRGIYLSDNPPKDVLGRHVMSLRKEGLSEDGIESLITRKLTIVHFSPYGWCHRDLNVSPCDKSLVCVKGYGTDTGCRYFLPDSSDETYREVITQVELHKKLLKELEPKNWKRLLNSESVEFGDNPYDQNVRHIVDVIQSSNRLLEDMEADRETGNKN